MRGHKIQAPTMIHLPWGMLGSLRALPFLASEVCADSSSHIGKCPLKAPRLSSLMCFLHWLQILDRVADGMVFGALLPCEECSGQLVFKGDAYYCTGDVTAWTKCMVKTQTPNRKEWVTPKVSEMGGRSNPGIRLQKNLVPPPMLVHTQGHHDCRVECLRPLYIGALLIIRM